MKNQLNLLICAGIGLLLILGCTHKSSTEGSAMASLRTLHGARATYQSTAGNGNFAASFDQLVDRGLIDSQFRGSEPQKNGYVFRMNAAPQSGTDVKAKFSATADPATDGIFSSIERIWNGEPNPQEIRHFYIDASGSVHFSKGRSATDNDVMLGGNWGDPNKPPSGQLAYLTEQLEKKGKSNGLLHDLLFDRSEVYFKLHRKQSKTSNRQFKSFQQIRKKESLI